MCLFLDLEGLRALAVLYRMGPSIVNTLLLSIELGAAGVSLGVHYSCTVAIPALILTEPANVAELVAVEVLADPKVCQVGFIVKDLGLLDKSAFI
jgi:hypothetical protein